MKRALWLLTALAACSVDTADIAFLPDDEFWSQGGSAGSRAFPGGTGAAGTGPTAGGSSDGCGPEAEGTGQCSSDGQLSICRAGTFVAVEKCQSEERCNATRRSCLDCWPGTFRCMGDTLEQCNLEGAAYELVRVCDSGACSADEFSGFCKVCEPEEAVCEPAEREFASADPTQTDRNRTRESLRVCDEHGAGTTALEICDFRRPVCDAEGQRCTVCEPSQVSCVGSELVRCSDDGEEREVLEDCGHPSLCDGVRGRCLASACAELLADAGVDDTVTCRGASRTELSLCLPSGQWDVLGLCDSPDACESGTSVRHCLDEGDTYCVPGTTECTDGNTLTRCAEFSEPDALSRAGGRSYSYATCRESCEGEPGSAECTVGSGPAYADEIVCIPGEPEYLDCSGTSCVERRCDDGEICAGRDWGCRTCVPEEYRCEGDVLVQCDPEGSDEEVIAECGEGLCDRFRGTCLPARPGERFCDGPNFSRVTTDGAVQLMERCASAELCSDQSGCLSPSCVVGSPLCGDDAGDQVLSCADGVSLRPTTTRCASADRCEDGLGCVAAYRVAAGVAHTCVLLVPENEPMDALGTVKCWGANEQGQLGNGASTLGDEAEARPVLSVDAASGRRTGSARFRSSGLCAGDDFTCADAEVPGGSGVLCWGRNDQGQLGLGVGTASSGAAGVNAVTLAVTRGLDTSPRDGVPDPFIGLRNVTCGANFACALDDEGRAWCWGANDVGQLGTGQATANAIPTAQLVGGGAKDVRVPAFQSIAAGARHGCGRDRQNGLWCWGGGSRGQLGRPRPEPSATPLQVELDTTTYALGRDFTLLASGAKGTVLAAGQNFFGQLGTGTSAATDTFVAATVLARREPSLLVSGPASAHACAFIGESLWCWGANPLGQLGDGSTADGYEPRRAVFPDGVKLFREPGSVAVGRSHTCAIDASGSLWCWGGNQRRQLGLSIDEPITTTPSEVLTALWTD